MARDNKRSEATPVRMPVCMSMQAYGHMSIHMSTAPTLNHISTTIDRNKRRACAVACVLAYVAQVRAFAPSNQHPSSHMYRCRSRAKWTSPQHAYPHGYVHVYTHVRTCVSTQMYTLAHPAKRDRDRAARCQGVDEEGNCRHRHLIHVRAGMCLYVSMSPTGQ